MDIAVDFSAFEPTDHMLKWLANDPYNVICTETERILARQVPGAQLLAFQVVAEPEWLTGGRRDEADPDKIIVVRTGVAFPFTLAVSEPSGVIQELHGVFSWVGANLDDSSQLQQRIWFDLGGTLEQYGASGELKDRLYFA